MTDAFIKLLSCGVCLILGFILPVIFYFAGYNSHPQDQKYFDAAVIISGIITIPLGLWRAAFYWKDVNKHSHHHHEAHHEEDHHESGHEPAHKSETEHQPAENHSSICYGVDLELRYVLSDGKVHMEYPRTQPVWLDAEISEDDHLRMVEAYFVQKFWSDPSTLTARVIHLYRNGKEIPLIET